MDGAAVQEIRNLCAEAFGRTITIAGREYSTTPLHDPRKPVAVAKTLTLHTLTGLRDYVDKNSDTPHPMAEHEEFFGSLHVVNPTQVDFVSELLDEFRTRETLATAKASPVAPHFGEYMDQESFVVWLQTAFVADDTTAEILRLVGNLSDEDVQTYRDDGCTQVVTARTGIAGRPENSQVPRTVTLRPYRTFLEVEQPASPFLLRMRSGAKDGDLPRIALHEADGGAWRLTAIQSIAEWLRKELGEDFRILA